VDLTPEARVQNGVLISAKNPRNYFVQPKNRNFQPKKREI
jgi:hypothetical protein